MVAGLLFEAIMERPSRHPLSPSLGSTFGGNDCVGARMTPRRDAATSMDVNDELRFSGRRLSAWALDHAFPLWSKVGVDDRGDFHDRIDQTGRAVLGPRRGRLPPRQIYVFTMAGALGWPGPWQAIVDRGLTAYLSTWRRPDGLFRAAVDAAGVSLNDEPVLYDQAFALFGLAHGWAATGRDEARDAALWLRETLVANYKHPLGGFREVGAETLLRSNPQLHLLEAFLAWAERDPDPVWRDLADDIAELALGRLLLSDHGALVEVFDQEWQPAPGLQGRIWYPGHQYEWGWLLLRWAALSNGAGVEAALSLIDLAEHHGRHPLHDMPVNAVLDDGSLHDASARLWSQTERIRAGVLAAQVTGDRKWSRIALDAVEGLMRCLDGSVSGLWKDQLDPDGQFVDEPAPAGSLYHIVGALIECERLLETGG